MVVYGLKARDCRCCVMGISVVRRDEGDPATSTLPSNNTLLYKGKNNTHIVIIAIYVYQRGFASKAKPTTSTKPPTSRNQRFIPTSHQSHSSRRTSSNRRRILIPSDNHRINTHIPARLQKTVKALTDTLPLQYLNLNIIVLGDLQHIIVSTTLHRMGHHLPPSSHGILTILTQSPPPLYSQSFPLIIPQNRIIPGIVILVKAKRVLITSLPANPSYPTNNNVILIAPSHANYSSPIMSPSALISSSSARPSSPPTTLKPSFNSKK